jgi:AcrR family transcriptional regulator
MVEGMPSAESHERTFTERARRQQLIGVTIEQVAQRGFAGASLARIAEAAGITKAAVLYHFRSKDALVTAAHAEVLESLVATVGEALEDAAVADRPGAYIRTMVAHFRDHPQHARVLAAAATQEGFDHAREDRWSPLAGLLDAAAQARDDVPAADSRALAVLIGGAIDGIVAEHLEDPAFDTDAAAALLVSMLPD